jgi:alpha-tubulin suppressor-like RCC1 family protein
MSLLEAAIRRRADENGRWTPSSLPAGVSKWVPFLLQREWRSGIELRTVATGRNRSFFVDANGALLVCGEQLAGVVGLLGLPGGTSQTYLEAVVPTPVPFVAGVRIRAVACWEGCNLAVGESGQVFEWGRQVITGDEPIEWSKWQPPVPTVIEALRNHRVRQVVAGEFHCAALTEDKALFTWQTSRDEHYGAGEPVPELGYGRFVQDCGVAHRVFALYDVRITSVAVGTRFTVAVAGTGAVYSFEAHGCLGLGQANREVVFLHKRIEALDGAHVTTVAAADLHTVALTRCGRVYSWGGDSRETHVHGLGDDG